MASCVHASVMLKFNVAQVGTAVLTTQPFLRFTSASQYLRGCHWELFEMQGTLSFVKPTVLKLQR